MLFEIKKDENSGQYFRELAIVKQMDAILARSLDKHLTPDMIKKQINSITVNANISRDWLPVLVENVELKKLCSIHVVDSSIILRTKRQEAYSEGLVGAGYLLLGLTMLYFYPTFAEIVATYIPVLLVLVEEFASRGKDAE